MIKKLKNNSLIILSIIALFSLNTTNAQVGIGTTSPDESASLELQSTTKGFLPPRLTTTERGDINSPAVGLTIYNTEANCLQWYNGTGWYDGCDGSTFVAPSLGSGFTNGFQDNDTCSNKVISVTPCSDVSGTTLNDDTNTEDGTEYDWTGATDFVDGGTTRALVEIGGQCWYRRNAVNTPSVYDPVPTWENSTDVGWSGVYTGGPFPNEGLLYQWSAAMNGVSGTDAERAQGVCPTGWHVPSDCEWMYLENSLGMTTSDQGDDGFRGTEGQKLSTLVSAPATNSSGFTALLAGNRLDNGTFGNRGDNGGLWWASSESSPTNALSRSVNSSQAGVLRHSFNRANGFSVRCLKD